MLPIAAERPALGHLRADAGDGGARRGAAVERPVQAAEGEQAGGERGLGERDRGADADAPVERGVADRPEHQRVRRHHDQQAPDQRALAQSRRLPLQVAQPPGPVAEATHHPVAEHEDAHLLGGGSVDREAVGVVGVALGELHRRGLAVPPHAALTQQPVGAPPGQTQHDRRPPAEPDEDDRRGEPAEQVDQAAGDEVHRDVQRRSHDPEVEVPGGDEVVDQLGILQVADAGRSDGCVGQLAVQPVRRAAPEVGADGLVQRREDLHRRQRDARRGERPAERRAVVDRADDHADGDGQHRRQRATDDDEDPPRPRQLRRGPVQGAGHRPLLPPSHTCHHQCSLLTCSRPHGRC